MLQDAARAVRIVRAHAEEWKIDPKRIGVIGRPQADIWFPRSSRISIPENPGPGFD